MKKRAALLASVLAVVSSATAKPPIESYGELPSVRALDIAPSGGRFAYLSREKGGDYFMIAEPGKGVIGGGPTGDIKARDIFFATDKFAIVFASETTGSTWFSGKWEASSAFSFDIEKKKFTTLLKGFDQLYPYQGGLGTIVGRAEGEDAVFMPAYIGVCSVGCENPEYGLLKARLNLSSATIESKGTHNTQDWFVDGKGTILARVDYDSDADEYRVFTAKNGAMKKIYQENTALPETSVVGVHPDGSGLILAKSVGDDEYAALSKLGFDGAITGGLFENPTSSIDGVIWGDNRELIGVVYAGMRPTYAFFDQSLTADMATLAGMYPDDAVSLVSWTDDFTKLVVRVEGGATAPARAPRPARSGCRPCRPARSARGSGSPGPPPPAADAGRGSGPATGAIAPCPPPPVPGRLPPAPHDRTPWRCRRRGPTGSPWPSRATGTGRCRRHGW